MTDADTPRLRYFFDAGSGVCQWAGNEPAKREYGYAIDEEDLPLSANTRHWLRHLIAWYDTGLDWDSPGGESLWSGDERRRFRQAASEGLERLRREPPPPGLELIDESAERPSTPRPETAMTQATPKVLLADIKAHIACPNPAECDKDLAGEGEAF